ncbi:BTR1 [Symbiodinium sp. CCMP2456]|nr:BTR1 [Symbiodinium sp. CCMP2456]
MNFPVPWRALLPAWASGVDLGSASDVLGALTDFRALRLWADAVPTFSGQDGLREICDATGAGCELSGEGDTPSSLSDKILTISGNVEQKEAACRRIVDKLRVLQEVIDQEPGVFVIIVPSAAAPAVIGSKGAQIKEVIELSGAEVSVAKESIIGMNDQPIGVTGTGGQVVSAVSKINAILQDLADRGRLQPTDFRYRPGAQRPEDSGGSSFGAPGRAAQPTGGNPRTNAKFVVATQVAGWIIGKQGRHIRELQENSGAHIQVLKEGEVPPGVPVTDRIVEIGGRFEAKAEGIQIILIAVDNMPALSAPRETLMLIPRQLTSDSEIKDVRQMSGCEIEVRDLPSHDEGLCTLLGNIESRVKAAQQFLKRLEEVMADGSVSLPAPSYGARPSPSETLPESSDVWAKPAPSAKDDPWAREDPWSKARDGGAAKEPSSTFAPADSKASDSRSVTFDNNLKVTDIHASYAGPSQAREDGQDPAKRGMEMSPNGSGGSSFAPNGPAKTTGLSFSPATSGPQMSFAPTGTSGVKQMSFGPSGGPPGGSAMSFAPNSGAPGLGNGGVRMSFSPDGPSSAPPLTSSSAGMKMSFSPDDGPGRGLAL